MCIPCWASRTAGSTLLRSSITSAVFSLIFTCCICSSLWISCDMVFLFSASCWSATICFNFWLAVISNKTQMVTRWQIRDHHKTMTVISSQISKHHRTGTSHMREGHHVAVTIIWSSWPSCCKSVTTTGELWWPWHESATIIALHHSSTVTTNLWFRDNEKSVTNGNSRQTESKLNECWDSENFCATSY